MPKTTDAENVKCRSRLDVIKTTVSEPDPVTNPPTFEMIQRRTECWKSQVPTTSCQLTALRIGGAGSSVAINH